MKDYYEKSMRALQLAGMSEPTQKGYTRSVRMLVDFYDKNAGFDHRTRTTGLFPAPKKC